MNIALIIFYIFIALLIIFVLFITITGTVAYLAIRNTVILRNDNTCVVDESLLVTLDTNNNNCCYSEGIKTGAYYVETSVRNAAGTNVPITVSVIPTQTYFLNVCREYCAAGYTLTNTGDIQCNTENNINSPQSLLANACVKLTAPRFSDGTPCRGSELPVAIVGNDLLYPLHAQVNGVIAQCTTLGRC